MRYKRARNGNGIAYSKNGSFSRTGRTNEHHSVSDLHSLVQLNSFCDRTIFRLQSRLLHYLIRKYSFNSLLL